MLEAKGPDELLALSGLHSRSDFTWKLVDWRDLGMNGLRDRTYTWQGAVPPGTLPPA